MSVFDGVDVVMDDGHTLLGNDLDCGWFLGIGIDDFAAESFGNVVEEYGECGEGWV